MDHTIEINIDVSTVQIVKLSMEWSIVHNYRQVENEEKFYIYLLNLYILYNQLVKQAGRLTHFCIQSGHKWGFS